MPRFAIGDLTIDVEVPARFRCEYSLSGSLVGLDSSNGSGFELSAIHMVAKDESKRGAEGLNAARDNAKTNDAKLERDTPTLVAYREGPATWMGGFGSHLLIATLTRPELIPDFVEVLASVSAAHDPFPDGKDTAVVDLRPSHTRWFEQKRTSLLDAESWSPDSGNAPEKLDLFWGSILAEPPEEEDLLNAMLSGVTVGFGDLLVKRAGFQWCIAKDPWGTSIAVVALRGTANVIVVPESFVAKRWERKEPSFIAAALRDISAHVAKMKAEWKPN